MTQSLTRFYWTFLVASVSILPILAAKEKAVPPTPVFSIVENFEGTKSLGTWTFSNGPEFPGATGSLTTVGGRNGGYAKRLYFEMSSTDAHYVAAVCNLAPATSTSAMSLWVFQDPGTQISIRILDETNQTLQYGLNRPLEEAQSSGWYQSVVKLDSPKGFWSGANDGVVHGKVRALTVIVEPLRYSSSSRGTSLARITGQLLFDDIAFLTSPVTSQTTSIDDFSRSPTNWITTVENGTGSVSMVSNPTGAVGAGATIRYNVSTGASAIATKALPQSPSVSEIVFSMKGLTQVAMRLRLVDSAGQFFEYDLTNPPATAQWTRYAADLADSSRHWAGANDGVFRGGVTSIAFVVIPAAGYESGSVDVDEVAGDMLLSWPVNPAMPLYLPAPPNHVHPLESLGVNVHFTADDAALDKIKAAGFRVLRKDLFWHAVEKSAGTYDFSQFDLLVAAAEARGLSILYILDYSNPLYTGSADTHAPLTTQEQRDAYGRYCRAAAAHFAGHPVAFEVWNEPDLWNGVDPLQYSALLKVAITQIRAGNPSAIISTGGIVSGDFTFLASVLADGGATSADAIGLHPYISAAPERLTDSLFFTRTLISQTFSTPLPVWNTEAGYSSAWYGDGTSPGNRELQATLLSRMLLTQFACDYRLSIVYEIRDSGTDPNNSEHNFGLLAYDYTNKPAYNAVSTLASEFEGYAVDGMLATGLSTLHAMKLHDSSSTVVVLWSSATADCRVQIPHPQAAKDLYGNPAPLQRQGDKSYVVVGAGPTYLRF